MSDTMRDVVTGCAYHRGAPSALCKACADSPLKAKPTRCRHGMRAEWCDDCRKESARKMGCGVQ